MSIPKKIHYCWFGTKEKDKLFHQCKKSWEKWCPDYEIIEWNESNFDYEQCKYCKEAYSRQKWAFVSDYARLKIISEQGGLYADTDVEFVKSFDPLLTASQAFVGFESPSFINSGLILGAVRHNKWVETMLRYYEKLSFIKDDGTPDLTTTPSILTNETLRNYPLRLDGSEQVFEDITIYPTDYFNPMNLNTGKVTLTENTYSIHHYKASWYTPSQKFRHSLKKAFITIFGERAFNKLFTRGDKGDK